MSKEYSYDLQAARSSLRRWVWKTPETNDRVKEVIKALEILDALDISETIDISPVIQSVAIGGLQFDLA